MSAMQPWPLVARRLTRRCSGAAIPLTNMCQSGAVRAYGSRACLLLLLFLLELSLLLGGQQGLFLLFPLALILASLVTHICFSSIEMNISRMDRLVAVSESGYSTHDHGRKAC